MYKLCKAVTLILLSLATPQNNVDASTLEAMKASGIGGATIFHLTSSVTMGAKPTKKSSWPENTYLIGDSRRRRKVGKARHCGKAELVCFRYNPGALKGGNSIIGHSEDAKYGFTREQLSEGYAMLKEMGVKRFGIHTMVASNELNAQYFVETAEILFDAVVEISNQLGINFDFVNIGGGIGIPYKPEDEAVDLEVVGEGVRNAYQQRLIGKIP